MNFKYRKDVWSLIRQNISKGQMLGYAIANIIGLSVILIGILFYCDSQHSNTQEDKYFSDDYIVLSKKVEGIGFSPVSFSEKEIEQIGHEKWVKKIGRFTSSQFAVNGSVALGGKGLSTYMFFEAVPDEFFDIKPRGWKFSPEERYVPIILCKDYLTLYNVGFAVPQGLPQLSEEIVGAIPIVLRLTGNNMQTDVLDANVVGFSSRLNTIAVPQSFMDWANNRYAPDVKQPTSRLIIQIDRMASGEMNAYLQAHEYEIAGGREELGKISDFLGVVSAVVTTNGIVICLLAMFILVLSIFLLLQKNKEKLRNLMLLGYHPLYISRYYELMIFVSNIVVVLLAILITLLARLLWAGGLEDVGLGDASLLPMLFSALIYMIGVTVFDLFVIRRRLLAIWKNA